jgi:hypothetical protein
MKIQRDIFARGVRMTHKFDELIGRSDPLGMETFDVPRPMRVDQLSQGTGPSTSQQYGQHNYRPDPSPVVKPSGQCAHSDGPSLDTAMVVGMPVPVGTKRRLGPPRTDK